LTTTDPAPSNNAATAPTLGDDLLVGCTAIAAERGEDERRTYYKLERGLLPATKIAGRWTTTRSILRRFHDELLADALERAKAAVTGSKAGADDKGDELL
jgi:hypothetical protein